MVGFIWIEFHLVSIEHIKSPEFKLIKYYASRYNHCQPELALSGAPHRTKARVFPVRASAVFIFFYAIATKPAAATVFTQA